MVKPDCEFTAGSSFDIDIDGNNLCGDPAEGDRSKAIIVGIQGVNVYVTSKEQACLRLIWKRFS